MKRNLWKIALAATLCCLWTFAVRHATAADVDSRGYAATPEEPGVEVGGLVRVDGEWSDAEVFVVEPGETVELSVESPEASVAAVISEQVPNPGRTHTYGLSTLNEYRWSVPFGIAQRLDGGRLHWVAPAGPGHYKIECRTNVRRSFVYQTGEETERRRELKPLIAHTAFHFLVPHKFDPEGPGIIEGYPIGVYPSETGPNVKAVVAAHRDRYKPPQWFVAVTTETAQLRVTENFRLREFVPDAPKDTTIYFPFNRNLAEVLETIRTDLQKQGLKVPRVRIVRGYVSPYEADRLRRQGVSLLTWNRYQYGDAAVIIVDRDLDDKMDDLNGDGTIDGEDARFLAAVVRQVQDRLKMPGWLGVYARRPDTSLPETPMVGFDLRGWRVDTYGGE